MEQEVDGGVSCNWRAGHGPSVLGKGIGRVENQRKNRHCPTYCIVEMGQNAQKISGYLRRLAVS